jgi:autoinducer 2-degrading protein
VSREQREKNKGRDLDEADIAQHQRGFGLDVKIPAHRDRQHLHAEVRKQEAGQEQSVIARPKSGVGFQLKSFASRLDWTIIYTSMLIVHVHVHVKPEAVETFRAASIENARNSIAEPGIERFDVLQQTDDPARFLLVEVYRDADAPARHKETVHYATWRDTVASMMAEPRTSVKYTSVFPPDQI